MDLKFRPVKVSEKGVIIGSMDGSGSGQWSN